MKKFSLKLLVIGIFWLLGFGVVNLGTINTAQAVVWVSDWLGGFGDAGDTAGLNVAGSGEKQWWSIVNMIKNFINRSLGIMWLIALVILLYGGFQMVTAAGEEEKYKKWFTILKQAAMGLIFIGIARFMVSAIFWILRVAGGGSSESTGSNYS